MSDVTRILYAIERGDPAAAGQLLPLIYDELRKLAAQKLARETPDHTLQATALVHEAYIRLVGNEPEKPWDGRGHFFASAAEAMRRILVDRARDQRRQKRGGGRIRVDLIDQAGAIAQDPDLILSLDELLTKLTEEDPTAARIAHLHLFGGLSIEEASEAMGISRPTAYRNWKYARGWLREALGK